MKVGKKARRGRRHKPRPHKSHRDPQAKAPNSFARKARADYKRRVSKASEPTAY